MMYRIYSKTIPEGVVKDPETGLAQVFTASLIREVEERGVYRGGCPCCGKRIVVREATANPNMTAGDEHYLLHDGGDM